MKKNKKENDKLNSISGGKTGNPSVSQNPSNDGYIPGDDDRVGRDKRYDEIKEGDEGKKREDPKAIDANDDVDEKSTEEKGKVRYDPERHVRTGDQATE
mgnify:CR=1 FL=1